MEFYQLLLSFFKLLEVRINYFFYFTIKNYYNPIAALAIGSSVFQSNTRNLIAFASYKYYLN